MSFTTPTADPATFKWNSAAIVNEIRAGINERILAGPEFAPASLPLAVAGDSAQSASGNFAAMQAAIETMAVSFLDHRTNSGDFSGLAALPYWNVADWGDPHSLFAAMHTRSWRRQTSKGYYDTPGRAQAGDLIGSWLFEDLQAALKLLLWFPLPNAVKVFASFLYKSGACTSAVSWADAVAQASALYDAASFAPGASLPQANTTGLRLAGPQWSATMARACGPVTVDLTGRLLPKACAFDLYEKVKSLTADASLFDANGDSVVNGAFKRAATGTYDGTSGAGECSFGSGAEPAWCGQPMTENSTTARGYSGVDNWLVLHAGDAFVWK